MTPPKKPGGSGDDVLKTAASAAGRLFARMRQEYRAGRSGDAETAPHPPTPPPAGDQPKSRPWWDVLGVRENADLAEITAAYRDLMRKSHPDKVAQLSDRLRQVAEEETQMLNAAYEEARRATAPLPPQ